MTEDPQIPLPLDEQSQESPVTDPQPAPGPDYVAEIRQDLIVEEAEQQQRARTGGLFRKITGSLKRVTGPLRRSQEAAKPADITGEEPKGDLPDPLLDDRLGEVFLLDAGSQNQLPELPASVSPPEKAYLDLAEPIEAGQEKGLAVWEQAGNPGETSQSALAEGLVGEDEDTQFAVSAGLEPAQDDDSNWMAEIRQEAASLSDPQPTEAEKPPQKQPSGSLRSLITGILKGGDRRKRTDELEMDDALVTGRLERSLHTQPLKRTTGPLGAAPEPEKPVSNLVDDDLAAIDPAVFAMLMAAKASAETAAVQQPEAGDDDLLEAQRALREESAEPAAAQEDASHLTAETEEVPLDRMNFFAEQPAVAAEEETGFVSAEVDTLSDVGEDEQNSVENPPDVLLPEEEQPAPVYSPSTPIVVQSEEEAFAIAYLTGQQVVVAKPQEEETENLLRKSLENSQREAVPETLQAMREIALEAYEEDAPAPVAQPEENLLIPQKLDAASWKAWLASRSVLEKILLAQLAIILLVVVVAVPFFLFQLLRGPVETLKPRALPANLPYPTGLTLPGGWHFDLNKSTFEGNQWKPTGGEWLEGTELRRVVALPWNRQTEAVVQTFQSGDQVALQLSNQDELTYRVDRIERIAVDDTTVYTDQKPSLVMILYNEKAEERWVVFCRP